MLWKSKLLVYSQVEKLSPLGKAGQISVYPNVAPQHSYWTITSLQIFWNINMIGQLMAGQASAPHILEVETGE